MRGSDLFTPRAVPVGHIIRVAADRSARMAKRGSSHEELQALSMAGLTLRQIADRVGLSHETVRLRLAHRSRNATSKPSAASY